MACTQQVGGRIVDGSVFSCSLECTLDSVSALMFFDPGRYETVNLKRVKNSAHQACRGFKLLAVCKYSKFL